NEFTVARRIKNRHSGIPGEGRKGLHECGHWSSNLAAIDLMGWKGSNLPNPHVSSATPIVSLGHSHFWSDFQRQAPYLVQRQCAQPCGNAAGHGKKPQPCTLHAANSIGIAPRVPREHVIHARKGSLPAARLGAVLDLPPSEAGVQ